jgi:hypothetical protein
VVVLGRPVAGGAVVGLVDGVAGAAVVGAAIVVASEAVPVFPPPAQETRRRVSPINAARVLTDLRLRRWPEGCNAITGPAA